MEIIFRESRDPGSNVSWTKDETPLKLGPEMEVMLVGV